MVLFLLAIQRDTSVEADAPYPRFRLAFALELGQTLPDVDERLLEQVVYLVGVLREHIAHGVNGVLVFPDQLFKFGF